MLRRGVCSNISPRGIRSVVDRRLAEDSKTEMPIFVEEKTPRVDRHVIVVDNDEKTLKNIRKVLTSGQVVVSAYKNSVRALEEIRKHSFDILISDHRMPHMDGLTLLNEAKRISPDLEVILITGYNDLENVYRAIREGVFDFFTKPLKVQDIYAHPLPKGSRLSKGCAAIHPDMPSPLM